MMAFTVDEVFERLQLISEDIDDRNYGMAKHSIKALMIGLCNSGITISSKYTTLVVGGNDHDQEE